MWVGIHMVIVDWIGLGQSASGLGRIGFSKMDPCPTLTETHTHLRVGELDEHVLDGNVWKRWG